MNDDQALTRITKIIGILENLDTRITGGVIEHLKSGNEAFFNGSEVFFDLLEDRPGDLDRRRKVVRG